MRKYKFWIFFLFFLFFLLFHFADAAVLIDNDIGETSQNITAQVCVYRAGQRVKLDGDYTIDKISFRVAAQEGGMAYVKIFATGGDGLAGGSAIAVSQSAVMTNGLTIFDFIPDVELTAGDWWFIVYNPNYDLIAANVNTYADGFYRNHYSCVQDNPPTDGSGALECTAGGACDLKFILEGEAPSQYTLSWIFPTDSATTTDFGFWLFDYQSAAEYNYIQVHYWNDEGQDYLDTAGLFLGSETIVEKAVLKSNALSLGDWYAEGFLISDDYLITYAQTDIIEFEIIATSTAISYPTASSTCAGLGWIGEPMCSLGFLLFVPKQSSLNNFYNLKTQLENKPPFGYATAVYEAFEGFSEATATTTINLSIFEQNIPNYVNPIKNALSIIIWLGFGFWIFSRVRHFEF